jgi:hypothetical protein
MPSVIVAIGKVVGMIRCCDGDSTLATEGQEEKEQEDEEEEEEEEGVGAGSDEARSLVPFTSSTRGSSQTRMSRRRHCTATSSADRATLLCVCACVHVCACACFVLCLIPRDAGRRLCLGARVHAA